LDRLQDYVRHKIVPPDELKKEYFDISLVLIQCE